MLNEVDEEIKVLFEIKEFFITSSYSLSDYEINLEIKYKDIENIGMVKRKKIFKNIEINKIDKIFIYGRLQFFERL
jgi:hypothetical protein